MTRNKDWPMPKPPPYPAEDEGMTEIARLDNSEIGTPAEQAFVEKLGMRIMPDGSWQRPAPPRHDPSCLLCGGSGIISNAEGTCITGCCVCPVPPPDVYEYFRRHGRWPEPGEA